MATRSNIGIATKEGFKLSYCHYDGYIQGVGKKLYNYYNSKDKALELINLGEISSLENTIEETKFYNSLKPQNIFVDTFFELVDKSIDSDIEFIYIFVNNEWRVWDVNNSAFFQRLALSFE